MSCGQTQISLLVCKWSSAAMWLFDSSFNLLSGELYPDQSFSVGNSSLSVGVVHTLTLLHKICSLIGVF